MRMTQEAYLAQNTGIVPPHMQTPAIDDGMMHASADPRPAVSPNPNVPSGYVSVIGHVVPKWWLWAGAVAAIGGYLYFKKG